MSASSIPSVRARLAAQRSQRGRQPARAMLRWVRRHPAAAASGAYLLLLLVLAVFAHQTSPYAPTEQNYEAAFATPNAAHLLGADDLGRDTFSRLIFGAATSLYACALAVVVAVSIGVPLGLLAGFLGGIVDAALSRIIDTLLCFPSIVLAIGITGALGPGLTTSMFAIGIVYSPLFARLIRGQTLVVRHALYVEAAQGFGASPGRVLLRHVLPNAMQPVIVQVTISLAAALLAEAGLSFLGLGVQAPDVSWGSMLARAYSFMDMAPEQMYPPGLAVLFTALAFNTLGEALRESLDPKSAT
jgi:peptide/nickel transport system permease protein